MRTVTLNVSGEPAPKGSRTVGTRKNGSVYTRPASSKEKTWQKAVSEACVGVPCLDGPYEVEVRFRFASPQKPKYKYPSRTDIDKLCRSTLDGLVQGELISDDRHVTRLVAQKEYGDEGAVILIRSRAGQSGV